MIKQFNYDIFDYSDNLNSHCFGWIYLFNEQGRTEEKLQCGSDRQNRYCDRVFCWCWQRDSQEVGLKRCNSDIVRLFHSTLFACRSKEKTLIIIDEIAKTSKNYNLHYINLDLPNYDSVRQFVKEFKQRFNKCDYLINNAGIFIINQQKNNLNHELTFATNHLGHFLLTNLLLDVMSDKSRIINVASGAHEFLRSAPDFQKAIKGEISMGMSTYATSKFANILFTQALQQKFDKENRRIKAVSLHPGFVRTEIFHSKNGSNRFLSAIAIVVIGLMSQFSLNEEQGSRTTEYTILQPYEELVPSGYYQKNQLSKSTKLVRECGLETQLWELSAKAVDL